jgi:hypothetical protein
MRTSKFSDPWTKSIPQELQFLCFILLGIKLGRQHSMEIIAACFGKQSSSLIIDDRLVAETPEIPLDIPWDFVEERLIKTEPNLSNEQIEGILAIIDKIWAEEFDSDIGLAKRLARNITTNCYYHGGIEYSSSVLLTEQDWVAAGNVACRDNFQDFMAESLPWPSIMPISMAKPEKLYEDRYQMEPGCILNIMAFLCPNDWFELLQRYQKVET